MLHAACKVAVIAAASAAGAAGCYYREYLLQTTTLGKCRAAARLARHQEAATFDSTCRVNARGASCGLLAVLRAVGGLMGSFFADGHCEAPLLLGARHIVTNYAQIVEL